MNKANSSQTMEDLLWSFYFQKGFFANLNAEVFFTVRYLKKFWLAMS